MVPSTMFAEATVISVGNAPLPSLAKVTESSANFVPDIFAELLISVLTIVPLLMEILQTLQLQEEN